MDDHTFCGGLLCGKKYPEYFVGFDNNFWDLKNFWMITHFVAVFCVGNNTLTTQYNIFWHLEKFRHFLGLRNFLDDHTFCGGLLCGKKCPEYFVSFDNNIWDLENFWMITHFVAVLFVENYTHNTL